MLRIIFLAVWISAACNAAYLPLRSNLGFHSQKPSYGKIVEGEEATIEDVPYQVAVLAESTLRCGGSILKPNIVMTSGHCTYRYPTSHINIRAGSSYHESGGQLVPSHKIILHEKYESSLLEYDYSLIQLPFNLTFDTTIASIALPPEGLDLPADTVVLMSGWGAEDENEAASPVIRKVEIPIIDRDACYQSYFLYGLRITERVVCAGGITGDFCLGDFGGPLVYNNMVIGVASWGIGCGRNWPGVYGRVSYVRSWLDETISSLN